jgi:hypothetical protein
VLAGNNHQYPSTHRLALFQCFSAKRFLPLSFLEVLSLG